MKEEKKDSPIGTLWGWGKPYPHKTPMGNSSAVLSLQH